MKKIILIVVLFTANFLNAQLKVGSNPTTIGSTNNIEIEAASSDKVFVNKTDGRVFIQNKPTATSVDSVVMRDANGEIRQISIARLMGMQDFDGDGLPNNTDSDDDGDGIADASDKCPLQYGCASNPAGGATHGCMVNCILNNSQSSNGTAIISAFTNCNAASAGTLQLGTAVSGVTQTITATVTTAGTYNIIASANGVTFVGTGYVAAGTQNIVLTASGTPQATGTFTYTLNTNPNCSFNRSVTSSVSQSIGGYNWCWGSCNGGAQGAADVFQTGYANVGSSFTLGAGNYRLSYSLPLEARGKTYSGAPNKPIAGTVWVRIVNTGTGAVYFDGTSSGRGTFSGCTPRGTGDHTASGWLSATSGVGALPAGTYQIQVRGESYMGGCSSGSSDSWAGCCPNLQGGGTVNVTAQ
jgi:hypothetical protein